MTCRSAARLGPWDKPLNSDLHINWEGEPQIPFALYVQLRSVLETHMACTPFPQFCLLPVELQRHILFFCDAPTLFQLMQSSSSTRHEAKKLFWSNPDTWYCIDGCWLHHGGYAGTTFEDLSSLIDVRRVNICFHNLEPRDWTKPKHRDEMDKVPHDNDNEYILKATDEILQGIEDEIRQFWRLLQDLCPHLTHVLISTKARRRDPWDSPQSFLVRFLQLCPAGINVSVSLGQGPSYLSDPNSKSRMERSLWVLHDNTADLDGIADQWEKLLTDWTPQIISLPPKKLQGPVGAFERTLYRLEQSYMRERATELLLIDAIERHHFHQKHEPFACSAPECTVSFNAPGEYFEHAIKTCHDRSMTLPENLKVLFDEHRAKLDRLYGQDDWEPLDQDTEVCDQSSKRSEEAVNQDAYDEGQSSKRSKEAVNKETCDEDQAMIFQMEEEIQYYAEDFQKRVLFDRRKDDAKRAFLHQLQHDPLCATSVPANESEIWYSYQECLEYREKKEFNGI